MLRRVMFKMNLKRGIISAVFVLFALGLLFDFKPVSAQQGGCPGCKSQGFIIKCEDHVHDTQGTTEGNCVAVDPVVVNMGAGNQVCIKTTYFDCIENNVGCPLGGGQGCGLRNGVPTTIEK